ncbi:mCG121507 [Mus musculus]|nr:mCG121507 [Mus musculus]
MASPGAGAWEAVVAWDLGCLQRTRRPCEALGPPDPA